MAVDIIPQYNRILDLTLIADNGQKLVIQCPRRGRKPSIEINGSYAGDQNLKPFNITVKNLYIDLLTSSYAKIEITAGYENNTIHLEGTIVSIYQESPGPEGRTVIQCLYGTFQNWLDASVQMTYEAGTSLEVILNEIKGKMGAYSVKLGESAKNLKIKTPFNHDGAARQALVKLETEYFADEKLHLFLRNDMLCGICYTKTNDYIGRHKLEYMSAPPQSNAGGEDGSAYTTVTAPWIPQLNVGDLLEIPQKAYMRFYQTVGSGGKNTQFIQVTTLSFHFGTTGGVNSMTVQGFNV